MSATSIPYHLRPNKAIDRGVFVDLLTLLDHRLDLGAYTYVGLGGPFMEDFRLIRSQINLEEMVCVERDARTHSRQEFNRPYPVVKCKHGEIESYLAERDLTQRKWIIWLDFTEPDGVREQIESFCDLVRDVAVGSVIKLTLNANPSALAKLGPGDPPGKLHELRRQEFVLRLGDLAPAETQDADVETRRYGRTLLRSVELGLQRYLAASGRSFLPACSSWYADGQAMVSLAGLAIEGDDPSEWLASTGLAEWEYYNADWTNADIVDVPALTLRERIELDRVLDVATTVDDVAAVLGESPLQGRLACQDGVLASYRKFFKLYPQFARFDL